MNICVDLWVEVTGKVEEYPPQESMIGSHASFEDCFLQMIACLRVLQKSCNIGNSALKSGPVSVLLPFLEGPRTGLVLEGFRMQEPQTGTAKKQQKTGRNQSRNEYNKTRARSAKVGQISCSLTCYVNFKLLIIKIG